MELSEFILVEWINENKFSVISRTKIAEDYRSFQDEELIGKTILCQWRKNKKYMANIIQCGKVINLFYYNIMFNNNWLN